jgi:hypothetical protein
MVDIYASTNKTYHNDIAEILLKVAPNTIKQTIPIIGQVISNKIFFCNLLHFILIARKTWQPFTVPTF